MTHRQPQSAEQTANVVTPGEHVAKQNEGYYRIYKGYRCAVIPQIAMTVIRYANVIETDISPSTEEVSNPISLSLEVSEGSKAKEQIVDG